MAVGQVPESIWMGKPWKSDVSRNMVDGLVYGAGDGGDVRLAVAEVGREAGQRDRYHTRALIPHAGD